MLFRPVFIFGARHLVAQGSGRTSARPQNLKPYCTTIVTVLDCAVAPVSAFVAVTTTGTALPGVTPCGSCTFT